MKQPRLIIFLTTVIVVSVVGYFASLYARGYRLEKGQVSANGLLVIKSAPDGAQVFINGEFKTATNANIALPPDTYDISVQKEGYITWSKRMVIEEEIVTETTAHLFKIVPSLSAITFSSSTNPIPSRDLTKIAYIVPPADTANNGNPDLSGLWIMEMLNLPLGFAKEPRRITDGNLTDTAIQWSPNNREIILSTEDGVFLLDVSIFTPQKERVNIVSTKKEVLADWEKEKGKRFKTQVTHLPNELQDLLKRKVNSAIFSPDEDMILYTASGSAKLSDNLIKQLPGASTQKQNRDINEYHTYVYDIKEDRNFLIDENASNLNIEGGKHSDAQRRLSWFPSSRHLVLAEEGKIIIMDYDGTNRQNVYAGSYAAPQAFPTLSNDRLIILTNLGATSTPTNLYSLSIK